jgi:SAM-dependent methyltransferase
MDALELRYEDGSFDGAFCSSSIEHFGGRAELSRALAELYRVLKPGGIASLSTEYRLRGASPGLPGTLLFDALELVELVVEALPWRPVQPIELGLSERTRATAIPLSAGNARRPHILLEEGEYAFTSVHLALRK